MNLKKVIILTESYPPNNNTAGSRPLSWAKYLHRFGYYPVIFCKNWKNDEEHYIETNEFSEVHYINCEEHYIQKKQLSAKNAMVRKFFGLWHYFFENSIQYHGVKHLFNYVSEYISTNNVKKLIATGPTFAIFGLAHQLYQTHQMEWIADYRDDWSSSDLFKNRIFKIIGKVDRMREKRYLQSCSCFTTVSMFYIQKISNLISKKGYLIENGFEFEDVNLAALPQTHAQKLIILYPGSVYYTQKLTIIIEALKILPQETRDLVEFVFLGTELKSIANQNDINLFLDKNVFFMKRVNRLEANGFLNNADLFLLITHRNDKNEPIKGIPSSKLYDFIGLKKQVLVIPSDEDIVKEKLTQTQQGIFCNNKEDLAEKLIELVNFKKTQGRIPLVDIPENIYLANTRLCQANNLAHVLDNLN